MRLGRFSLCAIVAVTGCASSSPIGKHRAVSRPAIAASPATTKPTPTTTVPVATIPPATSAAPVKPTAPVTTTPSATTTGSIRPASDPVGLAAEIADVESRIHDPRTPPDLLAVDALRQQLAFDRVATHPDWLPVVLARLPLQWRATVQANSEAAVDLRALSNPVAELPDWQVTPPVSSPATLLGYYKEAEAATGVPWQILAAVHLVESKMSRLRSNSTAGAQGPMQFLPATWASYGHGDIDNDHDAILGAADYLRAMGAPGDVAGALYHYNPSQHYVQAVLTYADQMQTDPSAFTAYYHWQVVFLLGSSEVVLPEGYPHVAAIPAG